MNSGTERISEAQASGGHEQGHEQSGVNPPGSVMAALEAARELAWHLSQSTDGRAAVNHPAHQSFCVTRALANTIVDMLEEIAVAEGAFAASEVKPRGVPHT